MSLHLQPIRFPLHGSRLIEASAGTGKTWTIAALYLRLVLGHGDENAFKRSLHPSEILVMTFTRAATRELTDRIRQRLSTAAVYFRASGGEKIFDDDPFLNLLLQDYPDLEQRQQAAYKLSMAADAMDEAAIFTIDAWCQRMLREHAFDSGCLFDEELLSNESGITENAVRDYWRQQVYPLNSQALNIVTQCWRDVYALQDVLRSLLPHAAIMADSSSASLANVIAQAQAAQIEQLHEIKKGWSEIADQMLAWFASEQERAPKQFSATKLKPANVQKWLIALKQWALDPALLWPHDFDKAFEKFQPDALVGACNKAYQVVVPEIFDRIAPLQEALSQIEPIAHILSRHAVSMVAARIDELKLQQSQFGFKDMLQRLKAALTGKNSVAMRNRMIMQYPVALIDEFQDTSPDQYAIFDALYHVQDNASDLGLFLIGDPKQSIYGFRGADIHSYLAARKATEGRHYLLGMNYRSTTNLVDAVNQVFLFSENQSGYAEHQPGAFRFRTESENPVPFEAVQAKGLKSHFIAFDTKTNSPAPATALQLFYADNATATKDDAQQFFAGHCAQYIVEQLNSEQAGFQSEDGFVRLKPADIAILVKDRNEASAIRKALQERNVASVYLSDKDSVIKSDEARDVLRWLQAFAEPLDSELGRAAFATETAMLSLAQLVELSADDIAWELRLEQLKDWHLVWQRQGVLAAIRRFIHDLALPEKLLQHVGGERSLTNVLHLAELLESATEQLEGEHALIRWFAEQIADDTDGSDEHILRLESDADLVKVITIHKSKGLEYPLVFLPFASSAKVTQRRNRSFFKYLDDQGNQVIDLSLSDEALQAVDRARIEEELRLFYVALTRASHGLWLGVSSHQKKLHESALGYLINGGQQLEIEQLPAVLQHWRAQCDAIHMDVLTDEAPRSQLKQKQQNQTPIEFPIYQAQFDRAWSVTSFSSIVRNLSQTFSVARLEDNKLFEDDEPVVVHPSQNAAWHRFPRGAVPGQFLHEQLEWMANEGFCIVADDNFSARLAKRCLRAGWDNHQEDTLTWLSKIASTTLLPLGASLMEIEHSIPEMEFWFPCTAASGQALDAVCQKYFLNGIARQNLSEKKLHGLLMGFADLVFEYEGKYWVLDYKSNSIGSDDAGYHQSALESAMAAHRYDVQGAIYMLALHRLLRSRLGDEYDPEIYLGGAVFFFLRGIANETTHGCYHLPASTKVLNELDVLMKNIEKIAEISAETNAETSAEKEAEKSAVQAKNSEWERK
ncbi:exodeoxyribonuclease V subunit beta [Undibacterium jejuense]|uniref:RecBCD enzyme subunit RecB n=1 Tax=Undibacterium jejuense TaxID=1344949 RepID=A0A923HGM9_9BURK|nr:exodeoxyribonuclease V subunit beta [Undibacterium jejuense]MBC3864172.1 exodeoxyribonuclease V subunit beta [Undibacterium jejuense]